MNQSTDVSDDEGTMSVESVSECLGSQTVEMTPSIPDFYNNQSIFITGGTGFMGKVLMEKLLRSCPKVKCVYVLIRPKKGQAPKDRLTDILNSKLFDCVRQEHPNFVDRVVPIEGDILSPDLGISEEDEAKLVSEVSIVFHSAATVKFDETLKFSLQMNVMGVKKLIHLCHKMQKLEAFIHVSTAYANCDRQSVTESVYPPPVHPQKLLDAMEWMDDEMIEKLTPKLIGTRPNTYTYTKALGEYLLIEEGQSLPIAIVRPSIVGASWKEPVPGWVDNYNGPTGLFIAIGKGLLRIMKGDFYATSDIIPVDLAVNTMIAVGWYTAVEKPNNTMVYNCTTGQINRFTWGEMERYSHECFMKNPLEGVIRVPNPRFTTNRIWHIFKTIYEHQIPAYFLDMFRWLSGKKPIFVRIYDRLTKSVQSLDYFTTNEWQFHNDNLFMLMEKLNVDDQKRFDLDVKQIDWHQYMEHYCLGAKAYILKDDMTNMEKARAAMRRLQTWTRIVKLIGIVVIWRILVRRVKITQSIWYFILQLVSKIIGHFPGIAKS